MTVGTIKSPNAYLDVIKATASVSTAFFARQTKLTTTPITWLAGVADEAGYYAAPEGKAAVCGVVEGISDTLLLTSVDFAIRIGTASSAALSIHVT